MSFSAESKMTVVEKKGRTLVRQAEFLKCVALRQYAKTKESRDMEKTGTASVKKQSASGPRACRAALIGCQKTNYPGRAEDAREKRAA